MIEEKYEILDKKFNELFARTANLIKLESKNKRSKKDLERSIKFLRTQYKGTFTQSRNRRCFYGTPLPQNKGEQPTINTGEIQQVDGEPTGVTFESEKTCGILLQKVSTLISDHFLVEHAST